MEIQAVMPDAMVDVCEDDVPSVDLVIQDAIALFYECDRIDAMADSFAQKQAMDTLLDRVIQFEQAVPGSVQRAVLGDALAVMS